MDHGSVDVFIIRRGLPDSLVVRHPNLVHEYRRLILAKVDLFYLAFRSQRVLALYPASNSYHELDCTAAPRQRSTNGHHAWRQQPPALNLLSSAKNIREYSLFQGVFAGDGKTP